jgi:hypothetical protein
MYKKYFFIILILFFGIALNFYQNNKPSQGSQKQIVQASPAAIQNSTASGVLGEQTKTSGCIAQNTLPDSACTPGAIFPQVTKEQVCTKGYTQTVRNVPQSEKDAVYREYGIYSHKTGEYEVDHFISLELGGSNDISNLWPEAAIPVPGFHQKDLVENYLNEQVCKGVISLLEAQKEISTNWLEVYNQMPK